MGSPFFLSFFPGCLFQVRKARGGKKSHPDSQGWAQETALAGPLSCLFFNMGRGPRTAGGGEILTYSCLLLPAAGRPVISSLQPLPP